MAEGEPGRFQRQDSLRLFALDVGTSFRLSQGAYNTVHSAPTLAASQVRG